MYSTLLNFKAYFTYYTYNIIHFLTYFFLAPDMQINSTTIHRTWLALHFFPFLGPARYAFEAIIAYLAGNDKKARDKGITATINGLIDLTVLALFLISAAHISVECDKSENLKRIKPLLTMGSVIAVCSILIGAKIVAEQVSKAVVERILDMHTASSAVVNSVTITATGIEAMVETINDATNVTTKKVKTGYTIAAYMLNTVANTPKHSYKFCIFITNYELNRIKRRVRAIVRILYYSRLFIYKAIVNFWSYVNVFTELLGSFAAHLLLTIASSIGSETIGPILHKAIEIAAKLLNIVQTNFSLFFRLKAKSKSQTQSQYIHMNGHNNHFKNE